MTAGPARGTSGAAPEDECVRPEGHEYQLLTRHPDPPGYEGVLPNAICVYCSEQTWFDLRAVGAEREEGR